MENNTQRRIHKYFFLIVFVSYFSAKFHLRECGNQQYTKRGRKKNHRGKVKKVERLQHQRFLIATESSKYLLIFVLYVYVILCEFGTAISVVYLK
jgi:hypothetical protein